MTRDQLVARIADTLADCDGPPGADMAYADTAEVVVAEVEKAMGDHTVVFEPSAWWLEHSFACRLEGMPLCTIHAAMIDQVKGPEDAPGLGRYTVELVDGQLRFVGE
jgi:hypothetical protein